MLVNVVNQVGENQKKLADNIPTLVSQVVKNLMGQHIDLSESTLASNPSSQADISMLDHMQPAAPEAAYVSSTNLTSITNDDSGSGTSTSTSSYAGHGSAPPHFSFQRNSDKPEESHMQ